MKRKKGIGIEFAILFMAFSVALSTLALSYILSMRASRQTAEKYITYHADLDQIGEYFMASVESGKEFPEAADGTNASIGDGGFCKQFASEHNFHYVTKVGYLDSESSSSSVTTIYHKLNVRTGKTESATSSVTVFSVIIKETETIQWTSLFSVSKEQGYEIVNWSNSDIDISGVSSWSARDKTDTSHSIFWWIVQWLRHIFR